jgi:hypothetical protein
MATDKQTRRDFASSEDDSPPERRHTEKADRRSSPRGGRRATDTIGKVATFVYKLLTETPR